MPLPGKPVYLRGGMSVPTTSDPGYGDSLSCCSSTGSSSFSYSGPETCRTEVIEGFPNLRTDDWTGQLYNPRHSMAFNSAKGLLNPMGQNNCFLNCAVQVLWHLDVFRRNFRLLSGHACLGSSCIFCALKAVFTQYQFSERPALPADSLRHALAHTFADQQRFQMGLMDDASECFENILISVHNHLAPDQSEDDCHAPHCLPHQKFTMKIKEQVKCECRVTSGELSFDQMVHYVATTSLMAEVQRSRLQKIEGTKVSFGQLLKDAKSDGEARKCSSNCGRLATIHRTLTNLPEVMSIGFIWDSEWPSFEHIRGVVNAISTELQPQDLFDSVSDSYLLSNSSLKLVGVVCYYSRHYSTFFFHSKMKTWVLFDDANIQEMGPNWRSVADRCCQGHYQPLLLLYSKENGCPINTTTALKATFKQKKADHDQYYQTINHQRVHVQTDDEHRVLARHGSGICQPLGFSSSLSNHSASNLESLSSKSTGGRQEVGNWSKYNSDADVVGHGSGSGDRQPSYLYAISGTNSIYKDKAYASYCQALDDAYGSGETKGGQFSSTAVSVNKTRMNGNRNEETANEASSVMPNSAKAKSVRFSNRVLGVLPGGRVESFQMTGDNGIMGVAEDSRHGTLPHAPYKQSSRMPCLGVTSCSSGAKINIPRLSTDLDGPLANHHPVAHRLVASFKGESKDASVAGKQSSGKGLQNADWLGRIDEDDEIGGGQYISAKKVKDVLMSQGVKRRRFGSRNNENGLTGSQKTITQNSNSRFSGSHNSIALAQYTSKVVQNCSSSPQVQVLSDSLENVSLGSHKDSGYRSGDSNADQTSSNSVRSSPSLDSGEFLPARNFQLIARDLMELEKQDCCEVGSGFSSSLESLSSCTSSQGSGIPRMQRAQTLNTIHEVNTGSCTDAARLRNNDYKCDETQPGNFQVSDAAWLMSESDRLGKKARKLMSMQEIGQALECVARAKSLLDLIPRSSKSESDLMHISMRHSELTSWQNRLLSIAEHKSNCSTISSDGASTGSQSSSMWSPDQELLGLSSTLTHGPLLSTSRDSQFQCCGAGQAHSSVVQRNKKPPATVFDSAATNPEGQILEVTDFKRISKQEPVTSAVRIRDTKYSNNGQLDCSFVSNPSEHPINQPFENGGTVAYCEKKMPQRQLAKEEVTALVYRRFSPEYVGVSLAAGTKH